MCLRSITEQIDGDVAFFGDSAAEKVCVDNLDPGFRIVNVVICLKQATNLLRQGNARRWEIVVIFV